MLELCLIRFRLQLFHHFGVSTISGGITVIGTIGWTGLGTTVEGLG